jgi:Uma2 family endonuclease
MGRSVILGNMSTTPLRYETFDAFSPYVGPGPYRAADYWQLPDGEPVELIEGWLVVSPSPTPPDQTIVLLLSELFSRIVRRTGGIAYCAPMDVVLSDDTIQQPDLLYISPSRRHIVKNRVEGPPDLVVEIASGTERRDRVEKLELYARYGVAEYWIVDPASQVIAFLVNDGGRYVVQSPANDRYQSPRLPEIEIGLSEFWREVAERLPPAS